MLVSQIIDKMNKRGPSTDAWGPPERKGWSLQETPFYDTFSASEVVVTNPKSFSPQDRTLQV